MRLTHLHHTLPVNAMSPSSFPKEESPLARAGPHQRVWGLWSPLGNRLCVLTAPGSPWRVPLAAFEWSADSSDLPGSWAIRSDSSSCSVWWGRDCQGNRRNAKGSRQRGWAAAQSRGRSGTGLMSARQGDSGQTLGQ